MTTLTLAKLAEIEAAAEKATPGPWLADCADDGWRVLADDARATIICEHFGAASNPTAKADAKIVALCDPATVAALCRIARAAIAVVDQDDRGAYVRRNDSASNAMEAIRDAGLIE